MKKWTLIFFLVITFFSIAQDETYEFVYPIDFNCYFGMVRVGDDNLAISNEDITIFNKYGIKVSTIPFGGDYKGEILPAQDGGIYVAGTGDFYLYNKSLELERTFPVFGGFSSRRAIGINKDGIYYFLFSGKNLVKCKYGFWGNQFIKDTLSISHAILETNKHRVVSDSYGNVLLGISKKAWFLFDSDLHLINKNEAAANLNDISVYQGEQFVLLDNNKFSFLNSNGEYLSEIEPDKTFDEIVSFDCYHDKIALCGIIDSVSYIGVIDINGTGNYYKKRAIYNDLYFNEYIYGYSYDDENEYLLKADSTGFSEYLQLEAFGSDLFPGDSIYIKWNTNIENRNVRVFYSDEDGNEYIIAEDIPVDRDSIKWKLPDEITVGNILFIELEENPLKYDYLEFEISLYRTVNYINANEITMWVGNNGMGSHDPYYDASGLYWPDTLFQPWSNSYPGIPAVFTDGPIIGYKINDSIKVQGCAYYYGFVPGIIDSDGVPADKIDKRFGIYKAFRDRESLTEKFDIMDAEYAQKFWPVQYGAPWKDLNDNGIYEPETDEPDIPGKQLLYWVNNTSDSSSSFNMYGSTPDNIEIQTYVFDIDEPQFKDVIFKRYKLINKTGSLLEDAYFGYWSDPDLGNPNDDYCGCDPPLNLGFCFNSDNYDDDYYGENPPAFGYQFVQAPVVVSEGDSAQINGNTLYNKDNLPMTSFVLYLGEGGVYADPLRADYQGTLQIYNNMQGYIWDGSEFYDPVAQKSTKFNLSGDPETGTGWYEGDGWSGGAHSGDRRFMLSCGPFTIEPGDTQDIVIAIMMARGENNLNSVTKLKELAATVKSYYDNNSTFVNETKATPQPEPPGSFALYQNYPNPFNPKTTIEFDLPEAGDVRIAIYDILGREVQNVVKRGLNYGKHYFNFNASGLASGIYFYRLEAGSFTDIKKMVLLK